MADEYTVEQQEYLDGVKKKYLTLMKNMVYDPIKARELVDYCYSLINQKPPVIYECESVLSAQLMANYLEKFHSNDNFPSSEELRKIEKKLMDVYYFKKEATPSDWKSMEIRSKFLCWRMDISEIPWVADYEAVHHLYPDKERNEKFEKYAELLKVAGVFMCITYDSICLVIKPPKYLDISPDMRLDSAERPVMEFHDGYKIHYVGNIFFTKKEWDKYFPVKTPSADLAKDILGIQNVEKRTAIVKAYGWENLLNYFPDMKELDTKIMYRKKNKNRRKETAKLYGFTYEREQRRVVCLPDTSTDKWYYILVPSTCNTVREAVAWHLQITPEQYDTIELES
jgi:hypothetical protein